MQRHADWTLVEYAPERWAALNQEGEVFGYGGFGGVWRTVEYWVGGRPWSRHWWRPESAPPRGAAYGEGGWGWRGPLPGLGKQIGDGW